MSTASSAEVDAAAHDRWRRWRAVLVVTAITLAVGWVSAPEVHWGDAQRYFWYGAYWPDVPTDHHALRLGLLLPIRFLIALLGPGEAAFIAAGMLVTVVFVVGAFVAGRELFDVRVGLLAFLLVLANPFLLESSAFLTAWLPLPDLASGGLIALGFAAASAGMRAEGPRSQRLLVAAGVLLAWAYLAREFVAVMFLALPVLAWARHRPVWTVWPTAATMLVILALESLVNTLVHGHPAARFLVASAHGDPLPEPVATSETLLRLWSFGALRPTALIVPLSAILLVAGAVWSRQRMLTVCLVWFSAFWLALTLLGGLLDPVSPSLRTILVRYWFPLFIPAAIASAAVLLHAMDSLIGRVADRRAGWAVTSLGAGLVALYAFSGVPIIAAEPGPEGWRQLRAWLREDDPDRITTDNLSRDVLAFYVRSPLGTPLWDGCVVSYWRGSPEIPIDRGGPLLVGPTSPPLPTDVATARQFTSTDGGLLVYELPSPDNDPSPHAASDPSADPASRITLCR